MAVDYFSPFALVLWNERVFYSDYQPQPFEPHSPVTQLIQGLYELNPESAQKVLRSPILMRQQPELMDLSMIRMAAKRFRLIIKEEFESLLQLAQWTKVSPSRSTLANEEALSSTDGVHRFPLWDWIEGKEIRTVSPRYNLDRSVRAVLLNSQGEILNISENKNSKFKTHHAEVRLLQGFYEKNCQALKTPTILVTNLQCCKMCAAMLWHMTEKPLENLKSYYLKKEQGPSARDTIFTPRGNLRRSLLRTEDSYSKIQEFQITKSDLISEFGNPILNFRD